MPANLFQQGLELMLFGMGTVFIFLALLVLATGLMSRLVARWVPPEAPAPAAQPTADSVAKDKRLQAVIAAAIHRHRSGR